jgi:hypothetical protein
MKINIKECCHSPSNSARFDAVVGDVVLIRRGEGVYVEAIIRAIPSPSHIIVADQHNAASGEKEVEISEIVALMLDD